MMGRMSAVIFNYVVFIVTLCVLVASSELLQNGGFDNGMSPWQCSNFHCSVIASGDSRVGTHALKTSGRTHAYQGPRQDIHPQEGKFYLFSSWIKILNDKPDTLGQTLKLMIHFQIAGHNDQYTAVSLQPLATSHDGWFKMQGEFNTPAGYSHANVYFQGPDPSVNFAVGGVSVTEINMSDTEWRNVTDANIERYRKNNINVQVNVANGVTPSQVQVRVVQTRKSFPFGTCVKSKAYVDPSQQKYRDFIHTHFTWATLENALKWRQLERHEGQLNYEDALQTIHGLRDHGLHVRGHNMVWSVASHVPDWVRSKSGQQLRDAVQHHIDWTLNLTHGLLDHWDVNNENIHGQWYQERLHDRDYDLELFRLMHTADPQPKLFLNDFNVVGGGGATSAYRQQAQRFKDANVNLYGVGVQSHFKYNVAPIPTLIKSRLDMLASVGLPIWATELDVRSTDENVRADWYETALRSLYGHPAVEGIIFWGFWGDIQSAGQAGALVTGTQLQLTAAGRRVLDLFENQWMTDTTLQVTRSSQQVATRGFHGDYELRVVVNGHDRTDLKQTFTLQKGTDKTLHVNVSH